MTVIHPPPSDESGNAAEDTQATPQSGSLRGTSETVEPASRDRLHEAEGDGDDDEEEEEVEEREGKAKLKCSERSNELYTWYCNSFLTQNLTWPTCSPHFQWPS